MSKKKNIRIRIPNPVKKELLRMNSGICCVCRVRGLGINFHHIDENPSNNKISNIAILCVKDHDLHHRPQSYSKINHTNLGIEKIKKYKEEWEWFVKEAQKESPELIAILTYFGSRKLVHSMRFLVQGKKDSIIISRLFTLHTNPSTWFKRVKDELNYYGENIKIYFDKHIKDVVYCPHGCDTSATYMLHPITVKKLTSKDWKEYVAVKIVTFEHIPLIGFSVCFKEKDLVIYNFHRVGRCVLLIQVKDVEFEGEYDYEFEYNLEEDRNIKIQVYEFIFNLMRMWEVKHGVYAKVNENDKFKLEEDFILNENWEDY